MAKKQVTVSFTCFQCGTENIRKIEVENGDTVKSFNLRRDRVYDVDCSNCRSKNSVKADA
jgi:hypothetical protein